MARSIVRTAEYNFVDHFVKVKKFNAAVNNLTIYTENKDRFGNYNNIYIKKSTNDNNFQIIYAKKGIIKNEKGRILLIIFGKFKSV